MSTQKWQVVRPRLAGICGSDLATVDGRSSRWFEPIVSFPFVPGHEVVADADDGRRVVIEPVLHCAVRGIEPPCPACAAGRTNHCERLVGGHLQPGLQTGFCADTGGGWSLALVAHARQLHEVPDGLERRGGGHDRADRLRRARRPGRAAAPATTATVAVVIGAGHAGAGDHRRRPPAPPGRHVAARGRQAPRAAPAGRASWAPPRSSSPASCAGRCAGPPARWILDSGQLTGGAPVVFDCVGSADVDRARPWRSPRPAGRSCCSACRATSASTSPALWQREIHLVGAYAYGPEPAAGGRHSFDLAMERRRRGRPGAPRRRPPTPSTATPTPSSTPPPPGAGARSRWRSTCAARSGDRKHERRMPRPGFVLDVDRSTPPILTWHGEGFRLERLPAGRSRVDLRRPSRSTPSTIPTTPSGEALLHPARRLPAAAGAAVRRACGSRSPSTTSPCRCRPMQPTRQPPAGHRGGARRWPPHAGVDDVVLICALALHRRMTEAELRHAVGDRVYDAFAPHGLLLQHDAEDPDGLAYLGQTDQGEDVEINRRAAESDLLVYVNINLVAMDGGHKSVATGLASYRSLRHHHNVRDHAAQPLVHGPGALRAALVQLADGPADRRQRRQGLPDRDHAQQRHLPASRWPSCRSGSGSGRPGPGHRTWPTTKGLSRGPAPAGPVDLPVASRRPTP